MSLGIYKPHQGYWVRVMTAIFAGVLVLACAAWAWQQAALFNPPTPTWRLTATVSNAQPAVGAAVTFSQDDGMGTTVELGTAVILSVTSESQGESIIVGDLEFGDGFNPSMAQVIVGPDFTGKINKNSARGIASFDRVYVQAGAVGTVLLIGAVLIYYVVGLKKGTSEFLIATDGEMKKVNWSTRKEIVGSTWVVVAATFLLTGVLAIIDLAFSTFFTAIHVLER